jgi:quercetin dioxygenase-like cupin family protein
MEPEPTIVTQGQKVVWDDRAFTEIRPGILGATVHTPQLTTTLYRYGAGTSWEEHQHPQDQVTTVLDGSIEFIIAGKLVRLTRGDTAALPGGTSHSASVPDTGPCVTINVLTSRREPPRAD